MHSPYPLPPEKKFYTHRLILNIFTTSGTIIITSNRRLLPYLEQEVAELGFSSRQSSPGTIQLTGTVNDCIRLNLNLRCAGQVLYSLKKFYAKNPDEVYSVLVNFPWEEIIPLDTVLSITSSVDHFTVNNSMFMNLKVKDAVADRLRNKTGRRPDSSPLPDRTVVHLYWREDHAEIFIDTSGENLSKHGYRKIPGKAPMLEALTTGTLMATKWDGLSPFINPMCGSGTVAIEAALLATHRRPGLFRKNYGFMHVKGYDEAIYNQELRKLREQIKIVPDLTIIATDIREEAVQEAKINAAAAGVADIIRFAVGDFETTPVPERPGVIYFNPEYGERLGDTNELAATYARIGDFMKKKCKGYRGHVFTGNLELAKKIGLKASRRFEFYSAKIDCRLLQYELY